MIKVVDYGKNKTVITYLGNMSMVSPSELDPVVSIALDMRKALEKGVSLADFEKEKRASIMRGTSGLHQKLFLISLDGLIKGVKDAYERDKRENRKISLRPKWGNSVIKPKNTKDIEVGKDSR